MPEMGSTIIRVLEIALLMAFVISIIYDSTRFVKREYVICSEKVLKKSRIVLLSDLHNKCFGHKNEDLIKAVEEASPDFILVAGDMVTAAEKKTKYEEIVEFLGCLASKYPVFYANGNHEYRIKTYKEAYDDLYEEYKEKLIKCGIRLLENDKVYLSDINVEICGLEIEKKYYKRFRQTPMEEGYIDRLFGKNTDGAFRLLIAHNPDYFKEYVKWGADLTVAGHVHGGVMRLPWLGGVISPMVRFFPKYDGGLFMEDDSVMVVSRGLGMHTIPVRIFNPGELIVIDLCGK
ncbi:hypothetical protein EDD76_103158 [Kineothrix alysoides]|uniref:Calcineurin-like phosphoesterase domain-containing protein n=1 Tax=Kineothrix alysoides TaxID=1469948 RepID=A0A4V2QCE3_9FIRM|nr:metallophosphoesterase [Kineothrix alysoides]TCL59967.1 hypothetical protein EDD76_103158 [Kineothrix alysoides]